MYKISLLTRNTSRSIICGKTPDVRAFTVFENERGGIRDETNVCHILCTNTVNPLLSPPLSNKSPPSNKPPLFRGRKLISPPSLLSPPPPPLPYLFFTNKSWTVSINHDCETSSGLTRRMVYLPTGRSDLILILSCMT